MTDDNIIVFSDRLKEKLGATHLAQIDIGNDELGNPIITGDLGPLEVSVYTSQDDGSLVVQIDHSTSETPSLRVYLNDSTIYDSNNAGSDPDETETGEMK